jgi:hypothetical protein
MKLLSLKSVYKNLLKEAIIDQGSFLEKLVDVITKKLTDESSFGNLLNKIIVTTKKSRLLELKAEQEEIENKAKDASPTQKADLKKRKSLNKKARKKAEISIHKSLQDIKGLNGDPIDLKKMRPLYDSIIQHLSAPKDVDIEHCLLAADYYMQDFYDNADDDIKQKINNGKIEFDEILKTTKFYERYFEFKSEMGTFNNEIISVYEDHNIRVVYPVNPHSFNNFINSTGISVSWCTQSPSTWESYNSRQFVMIVHDKSEVEGIISLKVNFDGSIDYDETCNVYNEHMDSYSVGMILNGVAQEEIREKVNSGEIYKADPNPLTAEDLTEYLSGLLDTNNVTEMFSIMIASMQGSEDGTMLVDASSELFKYAAENNKVNTALEVYADVFSSLIFDGFDISTRFVKIPLRNNNLEDQFNNILFEKALNKRSHIKYFVAIAESFQLPILSKSELDNKIKEITFIAANKNNPANFKKVLAAINKNREIRIIVTKKNFFPEFFKTKGFIQYFKEKKASIRVFIDKKDYHSMADKSGNLLSELITNNIDSFNETLYALQESGETEVTSEDMDLSLIARFIIHKSAFQNFDIEDYELDRLSTVTFEIKEDQLNDIASVLYTDLSLVKLLCKSHPDLNDVLLQHFYSKVNKWLDKNRINKSISFSNQSSYDVLVYLISNSKEKVERMHTNNGDDMPYLAIANFVTSTLLLVNKFGKGYNLGTSLTEVLKKIMINQSFFRGILHKNSDFNKLNQNLTHNVLNIASDIDFDDSVKERIKNEIKKLEALKNLNSNENRFLFLRDLVKITSIKEYIISSLNSSKPPTPARHRLDYDDLVDLYSMFYVVANNNLSEDVLLNMFKKYANLVSLDDSSHTPESLNLLDNGGSNIISRIISSTITIDKEFTKSIGSLIHKRFFHNSMHFVSLIIEIVTKCNEKNIGFHKEHLAKVFYSQQFKNYARSTRHKFLTNFITKGSDGEDNFLDTRDRVIVKNCLRDGIKKAPKSLARDYDFIMDLCANLDEYSKFQLRTAFPNEERIKSKDTNEVLIKKYIKLFFS